MIKWEVESVWDGCTWGPDTKALSYNIHQRTLGTDLVMFWLEYSELTESLAVLMAKFTFQPKVGVWTL